MEPVSVFISYSSKDKKIAGEIARALMTLRMAPFLAHGDSIEDGRRWKEDVREAICRCDMLVALVTPNFRKSEYTEQEVGAMWVQKKPILAILTDGEEPTGFISEWQGVRYTGYPPYAAVRILRFALSEEYGRERVVDMMVKRLIKSESLKESEYLAFFLAGEECRQELTTEQRKSIEHAWQSNPRVNGSEQAKMYLQVALNMQRVLKGS